ncbi:MAG: hypothetical protein Ct9H90mP4_10210 [Gammaproteobacteria bacterium]|nr:MAG: hypothetical protein Ct9H90mP4_10210 [Gammaproteobacteria bacterium]
MELFPEIETIGGEEMEGDKPKETTYDSPRSYCTKAINELGLSTYSIEETLKETGESYKKLGYFRIIMEVPHLGHKPLKFYFC